jgi:drug/metabolite transporter (DMT)-like permease
MIIVMGSEGALLGARYEWETAVSASGDEAEPSRRDSGVFVFLVLMVLFGSSTATAAKFAVRELPVGLLPLLRFGFAGLCLLPLVWRSEAWRRLLREDGWRLVAAAALCVPINQTFFLNGTRLAPTTHVALIYACCPLVVLLLATALGQERLLLGRLLGILISVAGAVIMGAGNLLHGGLEGPRALRGDLLLVGAVVAWGAYITVNKPLVARHGSLPVLAGTFLIGGLLDVPLALATAPRWPTLSSASPAAWYGLAYLGLVATLIVLGCQNQALRRLDASQVAAVGNAAPLLTVVWGVWFLGESLTPALVIGGLLILAGIVWTERPIARLAARG